MKEYYDQSYFNNRKAGEANHRKMARMTKRIILARTPPTVLDVGCGHGFLVKYMRERGFLATGFDWMPHAGSEIPDHFIQGEATHLPFADKSFDIVVSVDFFEHLPEEDIDTVYKEMQRVGHQVFAQIGFTPDRLLGDETVDTHITIKPREWWIKKLPGCHIY